MLVICPSPVVEGGSNLQGASASRPIPGCASELPGPESARSHGGIAVQMRLGHLLLHDWILGPLVLRHGTSITLSLSTLLKRGTNESIWNIQAQLLPHNIPWQLLCFSTHRSSYSSSFILCSSDFFRQGSQVAQAGLEITTYDLQF